MTEESEKIMAEFLGTDRRGEARTASVYRPVLIEADGFTCYCLVTNLSNGGLQGLAYAEFSAGEAINVQFPTGVEVGGRIVWSANELIGVQFDRPIDMEQMLRDLGSPSLGEKVNRAPRISVECDAILEAHGSRSPVRVRDISQRGAKVMAPRLAVGDEVILHLEGLASRKGQVRWSQDDLAGINFYSPIGFEELARWVIGKRRQA